MVSNVLQVFDEPISAEIMLEPWEKIKPIKVYYGYGDYSGFVFPLDGPHLFIGARVRFANDPILGEHGPNYGDLVTVRGQVSSCHGTRWCLETGIDVEPLERFVRANSPPNATNNRASLPCPMK